MKTHVVEKTEYTLVALEGPLDDEAKTAFDGTLHPRVAEGNCRLLVDLSGVGMASSAGIGHLVTLVSRANAKGGRVVFAQPTPFVRSVFRATKLDRFFDIEETTEQGARKLLEG